MLSARLTKIAARPILMCCLPEVGVGLRWSGDCNQSTAPPLAPTARRKWPPTRAFSRAGRPPSATPRWAKRHGRDTCLTAKLSRRGRDRGLGLVEVAGHLVPRADRQQRRRRLRAARHRERAARAEAAAGRWLERVRRIAGERRPLHAVVGIQARRGCEERLRVGMLR